MSQSRRFLIRMVLFLVLVAGLAALLGRPLVNAFMGNPAVNGVILGILIAGIVYIFRQVLSLDPELRWIEGFRNHEAGGGDSADEAAPRLLGSMARMLEAQQGRRVSLSAASLQCLLGGSAAGANDVARAFADLKSGLESPLHGMGTAFSASLFGLAGSLVLGFLDLQAGQAQNRFYNELEESLSAYTRLSTGPLSDAGDGSVPAYIQALLEQTADSLENLQRIIARGEESRIGANATLASLTDRLGVLGEQMKAGQILMVRLAENQLELRPSLARLAEAVENSLGHDDVLRNHMRNIEA